ncbi:GDP-mannose transporter GONST4 [Tanacetum coccineum]|uniref:GDP-mannose transporter GONST4 n=1 Tax=Tanacetum coccineum TaxID=301880 RepID=A0ABQ4WSA1_9ASTR
MEAMERLGSDELISIYEKLHKRHDRESFSQVSKNFLKARCISIRRFHTLCPSLLNAILPRALNLRYLHCFKPLSNEHMKLLAQSSPKLEILYLIRYSSSEENLDHAADYEFDFDDEGLCAVANACGHLYDVKLSGRLHVGDLGVVSLVRSLRNLRHLELARCVKITDESLKAIGEATCLKSVDLQGCYLITDLGLEYLANGDLKNCLKYLYLAECVRISDAGIIYLKQMVNLIYLDLSKCGDSITDFGISAIAKIQNIKTLRLCWLINVSDTSMFEIASNCLKLNTVDLAGCETITSEGLRALAYLPKLSNLRLHSCHNISWEDVTYIGIDQRCNLYGTTPIPSFFLKANKRLSGLDNLPERLRKGSSFLSDGTVGKSCEHAAVYGVGYLVSALGVWVLGKLGIIDHDPFVWETAKKYLPAAFVFYLTIFTNTNLLRHANVDTFIVFRALTPLLVAVADVLFRKQEVPSKFTFLSLVVILCGSVGYVATDSGFSLTAYSWAFAYLVTITTEMVYFKHVNGGNLFEVVAFTAVSISCVFGLLISFFGFACRKAISATAYTVTGVVNKFLTVAINVLIWDKHASPFGLFCLLVTIAGGILYQQSVSRVSSPTSQRDPAASKLMDNKDDVDDYSEEDDEKGITGKISGV